MAIRKLNGMLEKTRTNYVLDADIQSFFNHLNHDWIIKFVESKIKAPNVIRLIKKGAESRDHGGFPIYTNRRRFRPGFCLFTGDSEPVYVLRTGMVV